MKSEKELSYLIGAILGDGTIHKPVKRKSGGYYYMISMPGKIDFLELIRNLVINLFNYNPILYKRKDRENTWRLNINSKEIFNFITKKFELKGGKKAGNMPKFKALNISNRLFRYYLAGLIDTDGYVTEKRINLIQKDRIFLKDIQNMSKEILNINFTGPNVNRKLNNEPIAWTLQIDGRNKVKYFIREVPLKYKYAPLAQFGYDDQKEQHTSG